MLAAAYPDLLKVLAKVVDGAPKVETYQLSNSTLPKTAQHAAV